MQEADVTFKEQIILYIPFTAGCRCDLNPNNENYILPTIVYFLLFIKDVN